MTEQALRDLLARLASRGTITEDEAAAVLDAFRAGELDVEWPAPAVRLTPLYDDLVAGALLAALYEALQRVRRIAQRPAAQRPADRTATGVMVLGGLIRTATQQGAQQAYAAIRTIPPDRNRALAEALLDTFQREADRRAGLIARYPDGIRRFHVAMRQAIRTDTLALAQLGNGGPLTVGQARRLVERLREQDAYLQRFVEEIAAREAIAASGGRPAMSTAQVSARARMYGGSARAAYYEAVSEGAPPGSLLRYVAQDDPATCSPCAEAAAGGPYAPGTAPLPGAICYGRGLCRCYIEVVPATERRAA